VLVTRAPRLPGRSGNCIASGMKKKTSL